MHRRGVRRSPILPFYGLTERVAIAGEVLGQPQTYAFEPLYGVAELLDERGVTVSRKGSGAKSWRRGS